jgi:hypothetical protein
VEAGQGGFQIAVFPSFSSFSVSSLPQLLHQAHAVIRPNSVSKAAADALSQVAPCVNERAHAIVSRDAALLLLGRAGLLAAAVLCICRCVAVTHQVL